MNRYTTFLKDVMQVGIEKVMTTRKFPKFALMFHQISDDYEHWYDQEYAISTRSFSYLVEVLEEKGIAFLSSKQFADMKKKSGVLLTFDDAFIGVYDHVYPVVERKHIPLTVFECVDFMGQEGYLSREMIYELFSYDGFELGSHMVTHRKLSTLATEDLMGEFQNSKMLLEQTFGKEVCSCAYPYGSMSAVTEKCIACAKEAGYLRAFGTVATGYADNEENVWFLPRINVNEKNYRIIIQRIIDCGI